jgi:hypothetical protein
LAIGYWLLATGSSAAVQQCSNAAMQQCFEIFLWINHYWLLIADYWLLITDYWLLITDCWLAIHDSCSLMLIYWWLILYY